ncbi:hypothetical protein [Pseudoxanthomonas sp. UTMC 1351]|uniref:hypothetical protein n=1 Tax=Pseudoxanthomonas sp. UTMC 1351 TaxID=2695853 RepID=UPI0034CD82D9
MSRTLVFALALFLAAGSLQAADADPAIAKQLKDLGYEYEVDEDGDYKLLMAVGDTGRSQIVFIRSAVEPYGKQRIREIWSYAYKASGDTLPGVIANRLLDASNSLILGGWVKQSGAAVYVAKISADAELEELNDTVAAAASTADEMELELTADASDDY